MGERGRLVTGGIVWAEGLGWGGCDWHIQHFGLGVGCWGISIWRTQTKMKAILFWIKCDEKRTKARIRRLSWVMLSHFCDTKER